MKTIMIINQFFFLFFAGNFLICVASSVENPLEWQFRLVGGSTSLGGRVEMRPNATAPWGTICKDLFKENNFGAIAACNSAGLVGVTQAVYKTTFGPGTGPIYLTNVACTASDTFIQNCSRSPLLQVGACVHYEDVGVECTPPQTPTTEWEFKMVNGTAPSNGVVLMRPTAGVPWGTVYNYRFLNFDWVVLRILMCRALGYNSSRYPLAAMDATALGMPAGATDLPSYLYIWGCPSSGLTDIGVCAYYAIGSRTWTGKYALALDCDPPPPKRIGPVTVQLVNGAMPWSGMIWIQPNASENWFGITGEDVTNYFDSTPMPTLPLTAAQKSLLRAVCASAGFPNATNPIFGKYGLKAPPPSSSGYARLLGMNYNCSGSSTLEDCTVGSDLFTSKSRATSSQAGVDCFPAAINLSSWEFRIRPRTGAASVPRIGRVEVRPNNTAPYSGICSKGQFGVVATLWTALCHRLGFTNTSMGMRSSAITGWNNPLYYLGYSDVPHCPLEVAGGLQLASGATLQDCTLGLIGMHQCNENEDLILDCDYPPCGEL